MEGTYWFRISVIVAMFVGSIYVLLPTILQEDPQSTFAESAAAVETPMSSAAPERTIEIEVGGEDLEGASDSVEKRLKGFDVSFDRVFVEDGVVKVLLAPGATREQVEDALSNKGFTALFTLPSFAKAAGLIEDAGGEEPVEDIGNLPSSLSPAVAELGLTRADLDGLAGSDVPDGVGPAPAIATGFAGKKLGDLTMTVTPPTLPGFGPLVVTVDGKVTGIAWVSTGDAETPTAAWDFLALTDDETMLPVLTGGALLDGIAVRAASTDDQVDDSVTDATEKVSKLPPWLRGMLPDTRMNLGLDLQGGIDLTLQVELDEAVLSQVSRDLTYLKEQAAREGITITGVEADRAQPMLMVRSTDSLSELQSWFAKRMPDYAYTEDPQPGVHGFMMTELRIQVVEEQAVEQVLETLRKRVDATGVKEPSIVKKGGGRINVQLPGEVDLQAAVDAIGTTAVLEFRLVDEEFDLADLQRMIRAAEDALPPDQFAHDPTVNEWLWREGRLPKDRIVMWEYEETPENGKQRAFELPLKKEIVLTGNDINNAGVSFDNNNLPYVALEFKPQGSRIFCTITTENVKKRFAIILDGEIQSAPNIRERICGGRASIEMGQSLDALQEANTLALVLRTGSLNAPVSIGQVRTVGSTLGQDAINQGTIATMIGASVVLVFMLVWYRKAGFLADVSLVLNVMMVFAILALFGATLTLPGIAGVALTAGMAVDANIIIYERIREELKLGQHARKAVDTGFDKGLVAVVDANVTTAIAGIVLYSYGTGPIKGFAVTLLIGIFTTLVTSLFVNRTLMELITRSSSARLKV